MSQSVSNDVVKQMEEIYLCPISMVLMNQPFMMRCGHTFERLNIYDHLIVKKKDVCPLCRQRVKFSQGIRNLLAKQAIENIKKKLLVKEMKHKMGIFIKYMGLKIRYFNKKATLKNLMNGLCEVTVTDQLQDLLCSFSITCNGKLLNYIYKKDPQLMLNQFMTNNSTVNVERRIKYKK